MLGLALSLLSSVLNGALAWAMLRKAREHRSMALEGDARHLITDVWTSAGVVVGLLAVQATGARMLQSNPKFVLRNHVGELAIRAAQTKDFSGVSQLLLLLQSPLDEHPGFESHADFPPDWADQIEISCSS